MSIERGSLILGGNYALDVLLLVTAKLTFLFCTRTSTGDDSNWTESPATQSLEGLCWSVALLAGHTAWTQVTQRQYWSTDWLGFNGTFSTNRLYRAFRKYVAVKKMKLIGESWRCYAFGIQTINHYSKLLFDLVFVGETLQHERYHECKQTKPHRKIRNVIQLNKPKQPIIIRRKLTLIWSYSYNPRTGNEVPLSGSTEARKCQTPSERTNTKGVNPILTILQVALNPHRMTPFLLRPNKSAQLLKIIATLAKLSVSSSSSDVSSDVLIN